jgi:HD-like signal output (HDOD) protein
LFQSRFPALRERMRLLWSHSSHVAAISHVLAKRYTRLKPDEAMLAGLVHDIGKLPIIAKAENFPKLATNEPALDGIIERLHPPLGKAILETWHFVPALTAVAAEHENLARDSERIDYTDVVIVANLHSYLGKEHPHAKADWSQVPALNKLGLDAEASVLMMEEAREEIRAIRKLLTD